MDFLARDLRWLNWRASQASVGSSRPAASGNPVAGGALLQSERWYLNIQVSVRVSPPDLKERAQFDRILAVDNKVELRAPMAGDAVRNGFDELEGPKLPREVDTTSSGLTPKGLATVRPGTRP